MRHYFSSRCLNVNHRLISVRRPVQRPRATAHSKRTALVPHRHRRGVSVLPRCVTQQVLRQMCRDVALMSMSTLRRRLQWTPALRRYEDIPSDLARISSVGHSGVSRISCYHHW